MKIITYTTLKVNNTLRGGVKPTCSFLDIDNSNPL